MVTKVQYKKALSFIYLINTAFFLITAAIPLIIILLNRNVFITGLSIVLLYIVYAVLLVILGVSWIEKPVKKNENIVREYRRQF
ncbi:MAG: hypothetical protein ABIR81_11875 [Ginsengibacter sp.]